MPRSNAAKLASVKRSGVGVMSRRELWWTGLVPCPGGDEFEIVQFESGWAQVRLAPDSTGYIQADELNLPSGMSRRPRLRRLRSSATQTSNAPDLGFSVSREDVTGLLEIGRG